MYFDVGGQLHPIYNWNVVTAYLNLKMDKYTKYTKKQRFTNDNYLFK